MVKYICVIGLTSASSLVYYDAFVRSTFIGSFLNGRTYERYAGRYTVPASLLLTVALTYGAWALPALSGPLSQWKKGKLPLKST